MARLLIVEDEALIAMSLQFSLGAAGHEVRLARDGEKALAVLDSFVPEVVVTDYMMPRMDGGELIARLREDERTAGVKIILTSGLALGQIDDRVDGYDEYIRKPVSEESFVRTVESLLQRH